MKAKFLTYTAIAASVFASSCKDITELNVDQKRPTAVPATTLLTSAEKSLADLQASTNVNTNIFRLLSQQWTETTYTDEANYDISTRNIPQNVWHAIYRDVLRDLQEAKTLITADNSLDANVKKNQLAVEDVLEVYSYSILVNTFGNVPYTQALDFTNPQPVYDDAKTIHVDLIKRLDAAIASMNAGADSFGGSDLFFGGDVAAWKKFANTLKLRLGIQLADTDPATAKTAVESAAKGAISSSDEDAIFSYLASPPNTNPVWVDLIQSGRKDFVGANTFIDALNAVHDPRVSAYFTKDAKGGYSGGIYGASNNYATFSKVNPTVTAPDFPFVLADYSEVEFILAEAVERGFNVGGTAAGHYANAISASMASWGIDDASITEYLAQPAVAYSTASGDWKMKIGTQKWFALYNRGFEAWTEVRRLDAPKLVAPSTARSAFPVRFTYPVSEQNLNKTNFTAAAATVGGDKVDAKLFWDKF